MNENYRESRLPFSLPVAAAKNRNSGFYLDQSVLGGQKRKSAWKQEAGNGLQVTAAEKTARAKTWSRNFGFLQNVHRW